MKKFMTLSLGWFALMLLAGCGSGSGGSSYTPIIADGTFVDGPVDGLKYAFGNVSGVTANGGKFKYEVGRPVKFLVGGIVLGTATGQSVMTPLHLAGATDVTDAKVTRITRFLMSISTEVGGVMVISPTVQQVANTAFASSDVIETYTATESLFGLLVRQLNPSATVVSPAVAQEHMARSIYAQYGGSYKGTYAGTSAGTWNMNLQADGKVSGDATGQGLIGGSLSNGTSFSGSTGTSNWKGVLNLSTGVFSGTWDGGTFTGSKSP